MSDRYATILKNDEGQEIVSNISQMEGVPPEIRKDQADKVSVEKVKDGVKIGMVRGGPVDSVGGFGWPEGTPAPSKAPTKEPEVSSNPDEKVRPGYDEGETAMTAVEAEQRHKEAEAKRAKPAKKAA